jgi:DNA-binding NtrC family response regulator
MGEGASPLCGASRSLLSIKREPLRGAPFSISLSFLAKELVAAGFPVPSRGGKRREAKKVVSFAKMKKKAIESALEQTGGNRRKAAQILGIAESTLYLWLRKSELADTVSERGC